jgi:archaellum component FlaG (FlaF/FlaG flagellin family)
MIMNKHYMICIDNHGYEASLETRKLYQVLTDKEAEKNSQVRVIDESGEDYLYPDKYFAPVRLPSVTKLKLELTAA